MSNSLPNLSSGPTSTPTSTLESFLNNPRRMIPLMASVLVVGALVVGVTQYQERKAEKQREKLFLAFKTLDTEVQALPAAEARGKWKPAEKLPKGVQALQDVIQGGGKSLPVFEAAMALARLQMEHGELDAAVAEFKRAEALSPSFQERAAALSGVAAAFESKGDHAQAITQYQAALQAGDTWIKAEVLLGLARAQAASQQKDAAKATLERVIGEFPGSAYQRQAETLKGYLL